MLGWSFDRTVVKHRTGSKQDWQKQLVGTRHFLWVWGGVWESTSAEELKHEAHVWRGCLVRRTESSRVTSRVSNTLNKTVILKKQHLRPVSSRGKEVPVNQLHTRLFCCSCEDPCSHNVYLLEREFWSCLVDSLAKIPKSQDQTCL